MFFSFFFLSNPSFLYVLSIRIPIYIIEREAIQVTKIGIHYSYEWTTLWKDIIKSSHSLMFVC